MTTKAAETLIEEVEYLASKLANLREAEDLAESVNPSMYRDLVKLHRQALARIKALVRKILRGRVALGVARRIPIEYLERLFVVLRDQAEQTHARAAKFSGRHAKTAHSEANEFARLARKAAQQMRVALEARGLWNDEYIATHGLAPWIK